MSNGDDNLKAMGQWPAVKRRYSGVLAVCASGHTLWDDLYSLGHRDVWDQNFDIMAVNDAGMHIPHKLTHWYSNDYEWLPKWVAARRPRFVKEGRMWEPRGGESITTHSCYNAPGAMIWPWPGGGTSTLYGVYTGLALGYSEIVVCGAPLDNGPHYFDPPWQPTTFAKCGDFKSWQNARDRIFEGRVRSLSGNTKRILEGEDLDNGNSNHRMV